MSRGFWRYVHAFIVVGGITGGLFSRPGFAEDSGGEPAGSATDNAAASREKRFVDAVKPLIATEGGTPPGVAAVLMLDPPLATTPTNDDRSPSSLPACARTISPSSAPRSAGPAGPGSSRAVRRGESRSPRRKTFPLRRGARCSRRHSSPRVRLPPARRLISRRPTDRAALHRIAARSAGRKTRLPSHRRHIGCAAFSFPCWSRWLSALPRSPFGGCAGGASRHTGAHP